jgi:hypothetical protein
VLVQHAPVLVPAGEPLDRTSPDGGCVTRHRRRRSSPHFERLRKQFPLDKDGVRINEVGGAWISWRDYFEIGSEIVRGSPFDKLRVRLTMREVG